MAATRSACCEFFAARSVGRPVGRSVGAIMITTTRTTTAEPNKNKFPVYLSIGELRL